VTAAKLGDVTVLCAGGSAAAAGEAAAKIEGVAKVLVAEDASLGHRMAESTAALIVSLAGDYDPYRGPRHHRRQERAAARGGAAGCDGDLGRLRRVDADTFERPIYAGNAIQTVKSSDAKKVVSIRTSTFDAAGEQAAAPVETVSPPTIPACRNGSRTRWPPATAPN
jgi:electron transfer flavoprotein alpha subunit